MIETKEGIDNTDALILFLLTVKFLNMDLQVGNVKVVNYRWYTGEDCIGIVLGLDVVTDEYVSYIGVASGYNEQDDVEHILQWGTKFDFVVAKYMFGVS